MAQRSFMSNRFDWLAKLGAAHIIASTIFAVAMMTVFLVTASAIGFVVVSLLWKILVP